MVVNLLRMRPRAKYPSRRIGLKSLTRTTRVTMTMTTKTTMRPSHDDLSTPSHFPFRKHFFGTLVWRPGCISRVGCVELGGNLAFMSSTGRQICSLCISSYFRAGPRLMKKLFQRSDRCFLLLFLRGVVFISFRRGVTRHPIQRVWIFEFNWTLHLSYMMSGAGRNL